MNFKPIEKKIERRGIVHFLIDSRLELEKTIISVTMAKSLLFLAFLQNVAFMIHLFRDPNMIVYQNFLCFLSPTIALKLLAFADPNQAIIALNVVVLIIPAFFIMKAISQLAFKFDGQFPPKYLVVLRDNYPTVNLLLFVFSYLGLLVVIDLNLLCFSNPSFALDTSNSTAMGPFVLLFSNIKGSSLSKIASSLSLISLIVYSVLILSVILFVYPRRYSNHNALNNESKTLNFVVVLKQILLSLGLIVALESVPSNKDLLAGFVFVINLVLLIISYLTMTFYNMESFEFATSLLLVETFFSFLILGLNLSASFSLGWSLDLSVYILIGVLAFMVASKFQVYIMNKFVSFNKDGSFLNQTILKIGIVYFKFRGLCSGSQLPETSNDPFIEKTLSKLRNHFIGCESPRCFCHKIKTRENIFDRKALKKISFEEILDDKDGFLKVTASTFFYRYWIITKLKKLAQNNPHSSELLIFVLKMLIFEFQEFLEAIIIFEILDKANLNILQKFEIRVLKETIKQIFSYNTNHKVKGLAYVNIEKFQVFYETFQRLEGHIVDVFRGYFKIIQRLVH
jgi:hypothetical protein